MSQNKFVAGLKKAWKATEKPRKVAQVAIALFGAPTPSPKPYTPPVQQVENVQKVQSVQGNQSAGKRQEEIQRSKQFMQELAPSKEEKYLAELQSSKSKKQMEESISRKKAAGFANSLGKKNSNTPTYSSQNFSKQLKESGKENKNAVKTVNKQGQQRGR